MKHIFLDSYPLGLDSASARDVQAAAVKQWAQLRQSGLPTGDPKKLDIDVILAAQTLSLGFAPSEVVIATSNARHLSRFAPADLWENIKP